VAKFIRWKEDDLPIEIKISLRRAGTETGTLVADSDMLVFELEAGAKVVDLVDD